MTLVIIFDSSDWNFGSSTLVIFDSRACGFQLFVLLVGPEH